MNKGKLDNKINIEENSFPTTEVVGVEARVKPEIAKLIEIKVNPDTSFLFSHVKPNKEVPDDEIWVCYKNGKTQKFKLL